MFCITSGDVLHAFAIPSLGLKIDAVPGRLNTLSIQGAKAGLYYGQCSELCGYGHGFMPMLLNLYLINNCFFLLNINNGAIFYHYYFVGIFLNNKVIF